MKYKIGPWVFSPKHCLLKSNDVVKELEPLLFKLLQYFVANADRIIPRQELVENVWQANFVDDNAINRAISDLRKQMSHAEFEGSFVKTHYRKGYSLAVTPQSILEGQHELVAGAKLGAPESSAASSRNSTKAMQGILILVVVIGILWQLFLHFDNKRHIPSDTPIPHTQIDPTNYVFDKVPETWQLGRESYQAVSPDKSLFAYTNFYDELRHVFVKKLGTNIQTEVKYLDYQLIALSWQPGSNIFLTEMVNKERKECFYASFDASNFPEVNFANIIKSCDGRARGLAQLNTSGAGMYYLELDDDGAGNELRYFDILTRNIRLTIPSSQIPRGIIEFALSPNGHKILYKRLEQGQPGRFFVHDISSREDTKLLEFEEYTDAISLDWIDNTWALLLSKGVLTKVNTNTLEKESIEFPDASLFSKISMVSENQILGSERSAQTYQIEVSDNLFDAQSQSVNYQSDGNNYYPIFVGSHLYFISSRSGEYQYWTVNDGVLSPVTNFSSEQANVLYPPSGSTDGSTLVFRNNQVFSILDLKTGGLRNLTEANVGFFNSYELTEDKTKLYIAYTNNQVIQLWKYDLIKNTAGPVLDESIQHLVKDGSGDIYYINKNRLVGITKDYELTLPFDVTFYRSRMAMSKRYFYALTDKKTIYRVDLSSGEYETQTYPESLEGIAVSADDKAIILSKAKHRDTQIFRVTWQKR